MNKFFFLFLLLFIFFSTFSQEERNISGIVVDAKTNEVLPSASILIKGSRRGAVTNINGKFKYTVKTKLNIEKTILVVNFIGYKSQEIQLGSKSYFTIKLEEDIDNLDEIIVTSSYGTSKLKQDIVGSIGNVKTDDIVPEQVATSFDQLLEGQVAGVYIEPNNQLGEEVSINIRGQGSLTPLNGNLVGTSTQPLIIIDGVILSEERGLDGNNFFDVGDGNLSENILNPLAKIGIQDIESFNILKDAAAVGLYGADAANGVIIITTKSGKRGKLKFNASLQSGVSAPINQFKYLNGAQYNTVKNTFHFNNGDFNNVQPWNGVNTNWQELLNGVGTYSNYNFGVSGGNENWKYRANLGYQINNEAQINNNFKRLNGSIGLDYRSDKFSARVRFSPSIVIKNTPNTLYNFALDPTIPFFDTNGEYTFIPVYGNPLAVANQNRNEVITNAFVSSISLNYDFNDDLKFNTLFGVDFSDKNEDRFFSGDNGSGNFNSGDIGRRMLRERKSNRWNWSGTLSYAKNFTKNHTFDALLGLELRKQSTDFEYARGNGFANFSTPQPIASAEDQDYEADSDVNTGRSIFSQLNYDYKKKYYLLANFRIDQSSAFGTDKNTALNGGLGAAWIISNESFFKSEHINLFKLRSSFGSTGNSRIGSYRALGLYNIDVNRNGYNGYNYANPTTPPNPNLGWERNIKFNVGLDFSFFNKFTTTLEFFRDDIKDIITSRDVIPETGFNAVQINGAEMYNQGVEFSIGAKWISTENFSWSTNFNYSKIRNEVTNLTGLGSEFSSAENARAQRIGFPTSAIWGFNFLGIDPATGRELFTVNDNTYDAAYVAANFDSANWVPIGDSQPDFFGGLRNRFKYKNFTMNLVLSYAFGQDMLVDRNLFDNYNVLFNRNISANVFTDAWQNIGDNTISPVISKNNRIISNTTKYLFDASNIRLRSVNLSYNVPLKKSKIKNLSLFLNATNVHNWFITRSPEDKNGVAEFRNPYPEMRTISIGVNANF